MANTSPTLRDYAKIIYPDSTAEQYSPLWSYRAKFVLRATYYHNAFQLISSSITPPLLKTLCKQCPRFLEKSFRPYIVNDSSAIERAQFVVQHYQFVSEKLPAHIRDEIYVNENGLTLFKFTVDEIDYSFKLVFHARYQKEGDMSLLLFNDIDKNFYTLTFSVRDIEGQRQLVIGGLQGPASSSENNLKIKALTKKLHGQRPKDLMIKIITLIANIWQVDTLLAVKSASHAYSVKRYSKGRIKTNYDKHWQALGGTEFDRHFYTLSLEDIRRNPEDISRPKRAMYRRRYEWLDTINEILQQKISL
ncbi:DUF535 domain-containing protein [Photobacterium kishitanii]|uniref:VirK/YbjX family protein n=1 Tax=Photobacterium kishitanii TaxID=318456 RepID=UPI000435C4C6|nr:VirK/YbjX family protein [Photobacterium kishitanii]PSU88281.1 DUF535 domain-containing protein [Photobacterium kishitanii]PSU93197.1 DUF535 domain-containing protein [Photobacterium kishitanii]CEO39196.1 conserved hypothetical protein [Photobacterium kishitanii]